MVGGWQQCHPIFLSDRSFKGKVIRYWLLVIRYWLLVIREDGIWNRKTVFLQIYVYPV